MTDNQLYSDSGQNYQTEITMNHNCSISWADTYSPRAWDARKFLPVMRNAITKSRSHIYLPSAIRKSQPNVQTRRGKMTWTFENI